MEKKCVIDGSPLIEVGNLGNQYFSNFVDNPEDGIKSPLRLGIGKDSGLIQLFDAMDPEKMYRKYWYRSSFNPTMIKDLENVVDSVKKYVSINDGDVVLDIACNDGTLLSNWDDNVYRIGIDPAENLMEHSIKHADSIVENFYSYNVYKGVFEQRGVPVKRAKAITSIAMFYDLPDPNWFVEEVKKALAEDGLWVIQMSYTPLMLEQNAFDNICHEHLQYYTLTSLNNLLENHGFKIFDVELNDVNSGSFRAYVSHKKNTNFKLSPHALQIGEFRVKSILEYEKKLDITNSETWINFFKRVEDNKNKTLDLLKKLKSEGKKVYGLGASTKGNTLLQYYDITPDLIPYIGEVSSEKFGKKTVGTGIPIISESELLQKNPDYIFIFPWHFVEFFKRQIQPYRDGRLKFIVPLPEIYIV